MLAPPSGKVRRNRSPKSPFPSHLNIFPRVQRMTHKAAGSGLGSRNALAEKSNLPLIIGYRGVIGATACSGCRPGGYQYAADRLLRQKSAHGTTPADWSTPCLASNLHSYFGMCIVCQV